MRAFFFASAVLFFSAGALAATAPLDLDSGRPMVEVTVNGKGPFPFVLDTGAPILLVRQPLVDELGLEVVGTTELSSPAGGKARTADVVRVDSISLAGASAAGLEASVLDLGGMGASLGMGVIGPAVLREHGSLTLDFAKNTVSIGGAVPDAIETWLPIGDDSHLNAPLRIGDVTIDGHIDTGSPGTLSVPERFASELELAGPVQTVGKMRLVDAELDIRAAPIAASARIGDAEIPLRRIHFNELPVANVGTGGLHGLTLHLDWENRRYAITGTAKPQAPQPRVRRMAGGPQVRRMAPGDGPRFGIQARPSPGGGIEIVGTEPGSPAEAIGLLAGDRIVAVNGKAIADLEFSDVRRELAVEDLALTVERDGETLRLER